MSDTPMTDAEVRDNFHDDCGEVGAHPEWVVSETTCAKFIALSRLLERDRDRLLADNKALREVLDTLMTEVECLDDISLSRDIEPYKAQACWDYAVDKARAILAKTEQK